MTIQQLVDGMFAVAMVIALVSIAAGVWHWLMATWRGLTDEASDSWDEDSWL